MLDTMNTHVRLPSASTIYYNINIVIYNRKYVHMCVFKLFFSFMICMLFFFFSITNDERGGMKQKNNKTTTNEQEMKKERAGYILSHFICLCTRMCDWDASNRQGNLSERPFGIFLSFFPFTQNIAVLLYACRRTTAHTYLYIFLMFLLIKTRSARMMNFQYVRLYDKS